MSRIGKKLIKIPEDVEVKIDGQSVTVKGSRGELKREFPGVLDIKNEDSNFSVSLKETASESKNNFALWGLGRALLANMVTGVSKGFEKSLEFSGVGFKAQVKGEVLELNLGFSHPITVKAPQGITFQVEKNVIKVSGIDKEKVGHIAAIIRAKRPPEPYKGTGIKYKGEVILRKTGKKAATTGA